ncbi:MAG: NAD(+)/NADH kinase [Oscillospiraceae bacterium]|jgi:NAD+ kinase|nr:NAD(+)/NADH kinase [Oscillospiraceae bacterium]
MRHFALYVNDSKPGAQALAVQVRSILPQTGLRETALEDPAQCDVLIAIGGDGTILTAARKALPYGKLVLGINAGRLGFLAGIEGHELALLRNLAAGDYDIDTRMLLAVRLWQGEALLREESCINDAVVSRHGRSRLAELAVCCDGQVLGYLGDGVIFSTPTGSTAYSFSAGGPVVDPRIESILLTPICNHVLFSRSVVFSPSTVFRMDITQDGLALTCDAEPPLPLQPGQRIEVCCCAERVNFLRLKPQGFLDTLNTKLVSGLR